MDVGGWRWLWVVIGKYGLKIVDVSGRRWKRLESRGSNWWWLKWMVGGGCGSQLVELAGRW